MNKKKRFIIFAFILVVLKQILVSHLPIHAFTYAGADDHLMVYLCTNILRLKYLGDFTSLTFVKGISFPLFLSVNASLGISYIDAVNLLYSISCLVFIYAIKDLLKKPWMKYIVFSLLLFNPIMTSDAVVQRVYRNSLTPSQVVLIISFMFMLYQNRKSKLSKKYVIISILEGITLLFFYNTREDSIWLMPFVIVFIIIMTLEVLLSKKKELKKILVFIIPLIILFIGNIGIKTINYIHYGVFVRIDEESTPFADSMKLLYSVKDKEYIENVTMTKEKLERIYKVSPTLASIKNNIDNQYYTYDTCDRIPGDGEIEDGWFWWAYRAAVEDAGYYKDAKTANEFYNKVNKELREAFNKKELEKQSTMPSALMSPWKKGYLSKLLKSMYESIIYTTSFKEVDAAVVESDGKINGISYFETVTNNKAIYPTLTSISGYYTYDKEDYKVKIINTNNELLYEVDCNKKMACEVEYQTNISKNDLRVIAFKNKNELDNISLEYNSNYGDNYKLYVNSNYEGNKAQIQVLNVYVKKLNIISSLYRVITPILSILGIISYIIIIIKTIKNRKEYMDIFLMITSILLSYIVLIAGISYNHISSCYSISYMYLCAAYPLILMFSLLCLAEVYNISKSQV